MVKKRPKVSALEKTHVVLASAKLLWQLDRAPSALYTYLSHQ